MVDGGMPRRSAVGSGSTTTLIQFQLRTQDNLKTI